MQSQFTHRFLTLARTPLLSIFFTFLPLKIFMVAVALAAGQGVVDLAGEPHRLALDGARPEGGGRRPLGVELTVRALAASALPATSVERYSKCSRPVRAPGRAPCTASRRRPRAVLGAATPEPSSVAASVTVTGGLFQPAVLGGGSRDGVVSGAMPSAGRRRPSLGRRHRRRCARTPRPGRCRRRGRPPPNKSSAAPSAAVSLGCSLQLLPERKKTLAEP